MSPEQKASSIKKWAKRVVQFGALILVLWGVWQCVRSSMEELSSQQQELATRADELLRLADESQDPEESIRLRREADGLLAQSGRFWQPDLGGLLIAGFFYSCAMVPASLFWRRCLVEMDQVHHLFDSLWAYFYGNLGKYFPGKAMVIVLRVASLENHRVKKTATIVTIFMETLSLMAVGGAVAALCMILLDIDWRLTALAVGLLIVTFIPTSPPVIRFLLPRLQKGVPQAEVEQWTSRIRWRLFFRGWVMLTVGWLLNGLSLLFVLQSLPSSEIHQVSWTTGYLSATGACALAVVLGFVSLIPGGAGVRELVLSAVLAPVVGSVAALCAAFWLRIVGLVSELVVVGILFLFRLMGFSYQDKTLTEMDT